jgi:CBS domain-containing protein
MTAFLPMEKKEKACTLIEAFANSRLQRIVCYDTSSPDSSFVVSLSDLVRLLSKEIRKSPGSELAKALQVNVIEAGLYQPIAAVVGCRLSDKVIDAIRILASQRLNAIPIVEGDSKEPESPYLCKTGDVIKGTFSASDLRGFRVDQTPALEETVREYLLARSPQSLVVGDGVLDISSSFSVADFVHRMADNHYHRVWVVKDASPVGVISLGDFAAWILSKK